MRWDELFGDLEGQLDAAEAADLAAEVTDRTRREAARLTVVDRARASVGRPLTLRLHGAGVLSGVLLDAGPDWLLLMDTASRECLVPWSAVVSLSGLGAWSTDPATVGRVAARLDLGFVLRALARDRAAVTVVLTDGSAVSGTLDRVGADHVEVSEHDPGEVRRAAAVTGVRTLPHAALAVVRRSS